VTGRLCLCLKFSHYYMYFFKNVNLSRLRVSITETVVAYPSCVYYIGESTRQGPTAQLVKHPPLPARGRRKSNSVGAPDKGWKRARTFSPSCLLQNACCLSLLVCPCVISPSSTQRLLHLALSLRLGGEQGHVANLRGRN